MRVACFWTEDMLKFFFLLELGSTGRPKREIILETVRSAGCPNLECHCGCETRSPTNAVGEFLFYWWCVLMEKGKR